MPGSCGVSVSLSSRLPIPEVLPNPRLLTFKSVQAQAEAQIAIKNRFCALFAAFGFVSLT
jgi:hypothetical protein